jgi:hypothetical protein
MPTFELVTAVAAAILGALVPALKNFAEILLKQRAAQDFLSTDPLGKLLAKGLGIKDRPTDADTLFKELADASERMDAAVRKMQEYTRVREEATAKLEVELGLLNEQEQDLKERIAQLKEVPLPAADYFAQLIDKREKRSAMRDYLLFLLGVFVSAGVAILLRRLGWA